MAIGGAFPQLSAMSSPPRLRSIRLGESHQRFSGPPRVRARDEAGRRPFSEPIDQFEGFPLYFNPIRRPPQRGGVFILRRPRADLGKPESRACTRSWTGEHRPRDIRHRPDLRPRQRRFRARRGLLAGVDGRRALSRFRRRHRRDLGRPRPSAPGRSADEPGLEAVARFEPVPESRGRALCAPSGRRHLRRPRVLRQFGRRGQRGGGEDGAPAPVDRRPSRALSHAHLRGRVPRPYARDDRRRRPGQISRRLRSQGRRLRPDSADRPRGGRGRDRAGNRLHHDRADPGRGRGAARSARIPARLARDLRPAWPCADLR